MIVSYIRGLILGSPLCFSRLMPAVLHTLTERKDMLTNEIYLLSAVTALQRVVETLPHFISPYLQDTLLQVRHGHTHTHSFSLCTL